MGKVSTTIFGGPRTKLKHFWPIQVYFRIFHPKTPLPPAGVATPLCLALDSWVVVQGEAMAEARGAVCGILNTVTKYF